MTIRLLFEGLALLANTEERSLPLIVSPAEGCPALSDGRRELIDCAERYLGEFGAILYRGFAEQSEREMQEFVAQFGVPLTSYDFASTPRTRLADGIYSSTEYAREQHIPLHNEQSYTGRWPMKLWFFCVEVASRGGETPLADSRRVYAALSASVRHRLEQRGLLYVRNYSPRLDVPWQKVFGTSDKAEVEAYCRRHAIEFEWRDGGTLRTRQRGPVLARHPKTGEVVWFNQAHLFHISALDDELREGLLGLVGLEGLPRNVYYGDGSPLEEELLAEIRTTLAREQRVFQWRRGDVLLLDNMLVAHGRNPFSGQRRVLVSMAGLHEPSRPIRARDITWTQS
ncbi:MAG TPA: TauD/TfdA family dioxygenase [Polyangiaceae bacterium]|nr:TauD/TfdA family dioxygenase [Polyangiaceae bacterium]